MKKQSVWKQLYENLRHPRKACFFRFQRVGHTILYAFFLTLMAAVLFSPTVIKATIKAGQSFSFIFLPFGLIYYYIVLTFLFFCFVSILSLGGFWITKLFLKRRVNGQQAWILAVNAATWPTALFSIANLFYKLPSAALIGYIVLSIAMLINITLAIPKPKPRPAIPQKRSNTSNVH